MQTLRPGIGLFSGRCRSAVLLLTAQHTHGAASGALAAGSPLGKGVERIMVQVYSSWRTVSLPGSSQAAAAQAAGRPGQSSAPAPVDPDLVVLNALIRWALTLLAGYAVGFGVILAVEKVWVWSHQALHLNKMWQWLGGWAASNADWLAIFGSLLYVSLSIAWLVEQIRTAGRRLLQQQKELVQLVKQHRQELRQDLQEFRQELRQDLQVLRQEHRGVVQALQEYRQEMTKQFDKLTQNNTRRYGKSSGVRR